MITGQQSRRAAATVVMLAVLLWSQAGLATAPVSGHGPECHRPDMHSAADVMSAGCCPHHLSSTRRCPSHPKLTVSAHRPDCCSISARPAQPVAFVVTTRTATQPGIEVTPPDLAADLTDRAIRPDRSPFIQSIFDKKADLRI
jgi:hypothetical protein